MTFIQHETETDSGQWRLGRCRGSGGVGVRQNHSNRIDKARKLRKIDPEWDEKKKRRKDCFIVRLADIKLMI